MRPDDLQHLPEGLPIPVDDGACRHLPGLAPPPGGLAAWDAIPGMRGCTPQTCACRDEFPARHHAECEATDRACAVLTAGEWDLGDWSTACTA